MVVINLPHIPNPISKNAVSLEAHTDESVKSSLQLIQSKYGKTGSFIHLHPHFEFQNGYFTQHFEAEREIVKSLFFLAKHLHSDLNELGEQQQSRFMTVTRMDGEMGHGTRGNVSIVGGGIAGLVKSLNLEWSPVLCRTVDLQPELPYKQMADHIVGEFFDPNALYTEVGISEAGRKTTVTTPVSVPSNKNIETKVTQDSVFLVSGGARGVTARCVIEMAKAYQCKFILFGRSSSDFEIPAHAINGIEDGPLKRNIMNDLKDQGDKPSLSKVQQIFNEIIAKKEIDSTLDQIEKYGGQAFYLQGDVTNLSEIKSDIDKITAKTGAVTGIIHGAGRLADKFIQDKTESDFDNVISVKVDGLLSLLRVVDFNKLDHLILFSSVAGFYGNIGQTDYAIANEILSRAAHLFRSNHPNTHVAAINWGAWDSGMVSGELKAQFEAAGVKLVNSEGGAAMMVNAFHTDFANQPQVVIGDTLPAARSYIGEPRSYTIHRKLMLEDNPFLLHHVIQGNAVLPVVNAVGWMAQVAESLYPDFRVHEVMDTSLFKGIVFDGSQKEWYTLELKEIQKSTERIVFESTILSAGPKLPTNHYKAVISLRHKDTQADAPEFHHTLSGDYSATPGKTLYQDGSLFHDVYFQGIDQILDCTEEQMVLSCMAPTVPVPEQGQFPIQSVNTFFADIQYQGMVVWVQKFRDGAKSLPLKTQKAIIYKSIPPGIKLYVHVAVKEATEFVMVADCTVYDERGSVYMQTDGAAVTISKELTW